MKHTPLRATLLTLCLLAAAGMAVSQTARRPARKAPALTAAPSLPRLPPGNVWPEKVKDDVEKAIKNYAGDQVSAYLTFREILSRKDSGLKDEQRQWLTDSAALIKPRAVAVLNGDIKAARASLDLRRAYIAALTLLEVAESDAELQAVVDALPKVADLLKESFKRTPNPVWEITGVTGEFMTSYTEGFYPSQTSITANKEGYRILRVKARVRNVSPRSDPAYAPWALSTVKRILLSDTRDEIRGPHRLAGDTFINVVTPDLAQSFPCGYVTKENDVLRDEGMALIGALLSGASGDAGTVGRAMEQNHPGSFVGRGKSFNIDVLFPVPENLSAFRLVIIGSPPVPISIKTRR